MATYTDWGDGKKHTIPYAQYLINLRAKAGNPMSLPDPPVGTYDPAIDYNAGAANRGFGQTQNDAQTSFEQGQQDYGLGLRDLGTGRDRNLFDLGTSEADLNRNYGFQTQDLRKQFGILGHQQAEGAAQRGITSAGLLGKSNAVRNQNQADNQFRLDTERGAAAQKIDTQRTRVGEDYDRGKLGLDLGNARAFGGFNGQTILNPLTGKPEFGSLLTGVTRAGAENTLYQAAAGDQRAAGAKANGYVSPLTKPIGGINIGKTALTPQMYQSGLLLDALLGGAKRVPPKKGL